MKRHDNQQDEDLQRNIEEQERAMAALLQRVMASPLDPLHKSLDSLKEQLAAVQKANAKAAQAVEAGLSEALEGQGRRLNRHVGDLADGIDGLKEEFGALAATLDRRHTGQAERDALVQDSLQRADTMLAQLDAKADAGAGAIAETTHCLSKVDDALGAVHTRQQTAADRLSHELDGMVLRLEQRHAQLSERIDTLQPGLAAQFEVLAATIDGSAREVARQYETLSDTQKAVVSAAVQAQLALQLAPVRAQAKWLFALCGLSFASTLALLGMQLFR